MILLKTILVYHAELSRMALTVAILYNMANHFGLNDDVGVIERLLKSLQLPVQKPKVMDIREPLMHHDIQFHLEVPIYSAIPWAHTNVMLVNPEQWSYAYDAYVHAFDVLLFRDPHAAEQFRSDLDKKGIRSDHIYVLPWCTAWQQKDIVHTPVQRLDEFVCFIGGSTSKYTYVKQLLPYWNEAPPLTIYTTRKDFEEGLKSVVTTSKNVTVLCQNLDKQRQYILANTYHGHLICSQGESFGYAAANAELVGAFSIMNVLPTFTYTYQDLQGAQGITQGITQGIAWLSNTYTPSNSVRYSHASPAPTVDQELKSAFQQFFTATALHRRQIAIERFQKLKDAFLPVFDVLRRLVKERKPKGILHCPPILRVEDCPPISIVTPTYNRKQLIEIAFHNLLATDYPHDKIEWVVIEDNEKTPHMACDKIIEFQVQNPSIRMKYIPIEGRMSVGEKRNHAIEHATHDIILFMDDDDHYPSTSFRRRVAWLTKGVKCGTTTQKIACCTTIALYDLVRGVSAINVPPYEIECSQRISEATLTFYKSAWVERKFPNVSIAEGENWIHGREDQVIEIPPHQTIVAFSHSGNQSSRRIPPADMKPSCFWGFPKEFLIFIHGLVGVQVEEDTVTRSSKRALH